MWSQFACALSFLTILRVPRASTHTLDAADLGRSFSFFPAIGLLLGTCTAAIAYVLAPWMPPLLLAVTLTATLAIFTRALHLDGLADFFDGVGGGYTPQRRLEIMKDSRTGSFGAVALILALGFKLAALQTLIEHGSWAPLFLVPALSRYAMVLTAFRSPYARSEGGLGKAFVDHVSHREFSIASLFSLALLLSLAPASAPFYLAVLFILVGLVRQLARRWLGGVTGDVLGASDELAEVFLFALAACLVYH